MADSKFEAVYAEIRRLDQLRSADQTATATALTAAEKAVAAALAASEKAVNKAEGNQANVNASQNEFRAQLRDQAATFMPRAEVESLVRELRALIEAAAVGQGRSLAEQNDVIADIRTGVTRSRSSDATTSQAWKYLIAAATIVIGAAGVILTIITVTR